MPVEQIRPLLLIGLAVVAFLLWQAWEDDYGPRPVPPQAPPPAATSQGGAPTATSPPPDDLPAVPSTARPATPAPGSTGDVPASSPSAATAAGAAGTGDSGLISVRTDVLDAVIDPRGGTIRRTLLTRYPISLEQPDDLIAILDDRGSFEYYAESGLVGSAGPTHHDPLVPERTAYQLDPGADRLDVRLHWQGEAGGPDIVKIITFMRDSYLIGIRYEINNTTDTTWTGQGYGQFRRAPPADSGGLGTIYTYTGAVLSSPDNAYEKIDFDDMSEEDLDRDVRDGWVAMIQHYFASAWVPPRETTARYYTKALAYGRYLTGFVGPPVSAPPGTGTALEFNLYVGPKIQDRLEAAAPGLGRTVDYGWLFFIAQPLYIALRFIYDYVGNWGWAIIFLTFLIKLAFYHLSATSYRSMARMRTLSPKIQALRDRFPGDRQKMNQAMMELYKKEKINPLSGCLPIVVQIPVFIALYWVLLETVELRQASFILWLRDLSTHDPYFVLPLLMGGSMFLQQRMSPAPPDPIQAKVMMFMPVIFTGFFLFFPSGLVLYWFVNNLLSIAQQWVITRRIERGKAS